MGKYNGTLIRLDNRSLVYNASFDDVEGSPDNRMTGVVIKKGGRSREYVTFFPDKIQSVNGQTSGIMMRQREGSRRYAIFYSTGSSKDPRMIELNSQTVLDAGDMLFYDKQDNVYVIVKKQDVQDVLQNGYDSSRYETNYDTFIGAMDSMAHFVARADAMPTQSTYDNTIAATPCYYRIEIDNTQAGGITFSVASGNGSISSTTISWDADEAMSDIVDKFTAKNPAASSYIAFAGLEDGTGVGLSVGGYGNNTMTVTDSANCIVIDCSKFAFYRSENPNAPAVGGTFDPTGTWTLIGDAHHNFRGAAASSILSGKNLVGVSQVLVAVNGYNYSYRCGGNFTKFKSWASASGDSSFYSDGVNSSTNSSSGHVMKKTTFESSVTSEATDNALKMYEYYNHLLNDATGDYATLRGIYEARYGEMSTLYDAYLMSHMADPGGNSGIVNSMRNKGKHQTDVKGDVMNVTYNYVITPAYPPEYNAITYGNSATEGFHAGVYYHPEPGDIALFMRDDIMALVNANIVLSGGGTQLATSVSRGSCADCNASNTWHFFSSSGCVNYNFRYYSNFRSRPVLALPL